MAARARVMRAFADHADVAFIVVMLIKTPIALLWMAVGDSIHRN